MAYFADINVSQGSVATYRRYGGIFNIHLITNLPRNLPVIFFKNRPRVCGPTFWPTLYADDSLYDTASADNMPNIARIK